MWRDEVSAKGRVAFGRGLREARLGLGLSQRQLERMGLLDQTIISRLEQGRLVRIRISTLFRLIERLGISRVILLTPGQAAAAIDAHHGHRPERSDASAPIEPSDRSSEHHSDQRDAA